MVRYFGLYANAHRGKVRKSEEAAGKLIIVEEESRKIPRRGWAEIRRKVYEVDPLVCPECQGQMHIIAFLTDYSVVDRIIQPPQADVCGGEASSALGRFARASDGRRGRQ